MNPRHDALALAQVCAETVRHLVVATALTADDLSTSELRDVVVELSHVADGLLTLVPVLSAHASRIREALPTAGGVGPEAPAVVLGLAQHSLEEAHDLSLELATCVTGLSANLQALSPAPATVGP